MRAQRLELLERWAAKGVRHDLQPGMLVAEKPGLSIFRRLSRGDCALILWSLITPGTAYGDAIVERVCAGAGFEPDCMVGLIDDDGGTVGLLPHRLDQLMPLPAEDMDAVQALLTEAPVTG